MIDPVAEAKRRSRVAQADVTDSARAAVYDGVVERMCQWYNDMFYRARFAGRRSEQVDALEAQVHRTYRFRASYSVDHDAMRRAEYEHVYVTVRAPDVVTASLRAAQMSGRHGIPVATEQLH